MKKAIKPVTPSSTILDITQISEDAIKDLKKAGELLIESEARIRKQANQWGMRFEVVSDLASISGPFASIFYNQEGEKPFIILVFKGTGLSNFAEVSFRLLSFVIFENSTNFFFFFTRLNFSS